MEDLEVKFCSDCWALGAAEAHHQDKVTFGGKAQSHPGLDVVPSKEDFTYVNKAFNFNPSL